MQKQLPSTGLYTLNVSDVGANDAGAYTLHLDRYTPISNWLGFGYGAPSPYGIDHLGDSDYFAFNVNSGSQFRLTVATRSPLNTRVEVWDTSGALIRSVACTGFTTSGSCTLLLDLSASANGFYKVGVHDVGWDSIGTYQIGVTCLFGNCATGVPIAPVPELPSVWLLSLGTAALGWRRFRRGEHEHGS